MDLKTQVMVVGGGATGAAVLRDLAPHCIEGTGGLFVLLPEHDQSDGDAFMEGCRKTGVPCEELTVAEARRREPLLTPRLSRVSAVPDGTFVEKYDIAMDVGPRCGSRRRRAGPIFIMCDSETCCWHIAKATGLPVYHPVQVLDRAYRSRPPPSGQECADDHCD